MAEAEDGGAEKAGQVRAFGTAVSRAAHLPLPLISVDLDGRSSDRSSRIESEDEELDVDGGEGKWSWKSHASSLSSDSEVVGEAEGRHADRLLVEAQARALAPSCSPSPSAPSSSAPSSSVSSIRSHAELVWRSDEPRRGRCAEPGGGSEARLMEEPDEGPARRCEGIMLDRDMLVSGRDAGYRWMLKRSGKTGDVRGRC